MPIIKKSDIIRRTENDTSTTETMTRTASSEERVKNHGPKISWPTPTILLRNTVGFIITTATFGALCYGYSLGVSSVIKMTM